MSLISIWQPSASKSRSRSYRREIVAHGGATRYFRFPFKFDQMVFLSQIQQGLAIKTAIEYWRSTKPRCMGMLYWQINDTYPVAS